LVTNESLASNMIFNLRYELKSATH
jgi:hypothetical protein